MAKFYGKIGYAMTTEVEPGVWVDDEPVERTYIGDVISKTFRYENSGSTNDNVILNKIFSIVVDPFAIENYGYIKYVEYLDTKWKVTSVEPELPRLNITVGGVYNG